jgi:hypothetical protein
LPCLNRPDCRVGEETLGACKFLADKRKDHSDQQSKFWFGQIKPADKTQGDSRTLLWSSYYVCDHGPEDFRLRAGNLSAGKDKAAGQRSSKKDSGFSLKVKTCNIVSGRDLSYLLSFVRLVRGHLR